MKELYPDRHRKQPLNDDFYRAQYKRLSAVHRFGFGFRPKNSFNPSQKAAITRALKRHGRMLDRVEDGRAEFIKVKSRATRRALQSQAPEVAQKTNKGLLFYLPEDVKPKIRGKGKKARLVYTEDRIFKQGELKFRRYREYIPFHGDPTFWEPWLRQIIDIYSRPPKELLRLHLAFNGVQGKHFRPQDLFKYLTDRADEFFNPNRIYKDKRTGEVKQVNNDFSGVYVVYRIPVK